MPIAPTPKRGELFPRLSVQRPVTMGVVFAALLVLGFISYRAIPLQLVPSGYDPPFLYVRIPTLSSNPKDVEEQVALPAEELLATVRHVRRLRTRVSEDSVSFRIEFDDGANMTEAYNEVRDRLERALVVLPEDVERYWIWKYDPNESPIFYFGVTIDNPDEPEDTVERHRQTLVDHLLREVENLPGVSRVEMEGAREEIVQIEIDDQRARAAGFSTAQIVQVLRQDNFVSSGGALDFDTRLTIRIDARFGSLEDIRQLPIGPGVHLKDLARVQAQFEDTGQVRRINGRDGVVFAVYKEALANTVEVCDAIDATLESQSGQDPALKIFKMHRFFNQGDLILESINNLKDTGLYGALFAVIVLFTFLRQPRMTLTITVAIPLSLLITLIVMHFTGFTLNLLTLMGLMLSVGMVIDNSIVVVENIQRLYTEGVPLRRAAIEGTAEVALALLVATSTTVIVFLPMILMSGNASLSFYLGKVGYPVCISLIASLFVSLLFIPIGTILVLSAFSKKKKVKMPKPSRVLQAIEGGYRRLLGAGLRNRFNFALIALAITATIVIPLQHVQQVDESSGQLNDLTLRFHLPPSMTFDERIEYFAAVDEVLLSKAEEFEIDSVMTQFQRGRGRQRVQVFLSPTMRVKLPPRTPSSRRCPSSSPNTQESSTVWAGVVLDGATAIPPLTYDCSAPILASSPSFQRTLSHVSKGCLRSSAWRADLDEDAVDELHLNVQRDLAQRQGLSSMLIGANVDYALRGRASRICACLSVRFRYAQLVTKIYVLTKTSCLTSTSKVNNRPAPPK